MDDRIAGVLIFIAILIIGLSVFATAVVDRRLNKYEDIVAEYVMCIKYNADCECSDIILSEYEDEAK